MSQDGNQSAVGDTQEALAQRLELESGVTGLDIDQTSPDVLTRLVGGTFYGALAALSWKTLVSDGHFAQFVSGGLSGQMTEAGTRVAVSLMSLLTGKASSEALQALSSGLLGGSVAAGKASALALFFGFAYCPIGRLAIGRSLKRRALAGHTGPLTLDYYTDLAAHKRRASVMPVPPSQHSHSTDDDASGQDAAPVSWPALVWERILALCVKAVAPAAMGVLGAVILPRLAVYLASRSFTGRGILMAIVTALRVIFAIITSTAFLLFARPKHFVPSTPWKTESNLALQHPSSATSKKIGVLVCNLGTTPTPRPRDVEVFLREFLMDARVVEARRSVWWAVLNFFIIPIRRFTSGRLYDRLFQNAETDGQSPLLFHGHRLVESLAEQLGPQFDVQLGMRYGDPSIASAIAELKKRGCQRIVLFPLYPQYSATTTASIYDEAFRQALAYRLVPTVRTVAPYYAHEGYIRALVQVTKEFLQDKPPCEKYILSFHGIPQRYFNRGDPYPFHCEETAKRMAKGMGWADDQWLMTYQSQFGKDPWLRPATDETCELLGDQGLKRICVVCPGFLADCLETIDENGQENTKLFQEHGGEELVVVPCLNSHPAWCMAAAQIVREEAAGWVEQEVEEEP